MLDHLCVPAFGDDRFYSLWEFLIRVARYTSNAAKGLEKILEEKVSGVNYKIALATIRIPDDNYIDFSAAAGGAPVVSSPAD